MKKLLFYLHLLSALFIIAREVLGYTGFRAHLTLGFLVYLILIVLPEIFKGRLLVRALLILPVIGIFKFYPHILVYIIPLHISRLLLSLYISRKPWYLVLYLIPLPFIDRKELFVYLLITSAVALISFFIDFYINKMERTQSKLDNLEKENYRLNKLLITSNELDIQKEYLLKLEERSKIAQRLHDELGHTISGSIFQLEAVTLLMDEDLDRAKSMVESVSTVLNNGINSIRKSLKVIKPKAGDLGMEGIRTLFLDFKKANNIDYRVEVNGNISSINNRCWFVIIGNLKEFMTNSLKYGKASRIDFTIDILNKLIRVRIHDDGVGCKHIKPGMGISGMEERTASVGGTLIVDGSKGFSATMLFKRG